MATWAIVANSTDPEGPDEAAETVAAVASVDPVPRQPTGEKPQPRLDHRYLPDRTRLVFSLRMSALAGDPPVQEMIRRAGPQWDSSIGRLLKSFNLGLGNIRRLTWAATDLPAWQDRSVVLIELEKDQDAGLLRGVGEPVDLQFAGGPCRRLPGAGWSAPFAILDQKTIVTGPRELLQELAGRTEPKLQSPAVDRLLKEGPADAEFSLLVDLTAARKAGWPLPGSWLDAWSPGKDSWHAICNTPQGLGLWLHKADAVQSDLALPCEGESAAERVRAALDRFIPAARAALDSAAETAESDAALWKEVRDALAVARWEAGAGTVWLRIKWGQRLPLLASAALEGRLATDRSLPGALLKPGKADPLASAAAPGPKPSPTGRTPPDQAPAQADKTPKAPNPPDARLAEPESGDEPAEDETPEQSGLAAPRPDSTVPAKVDVQARLADRYPEVNLSAVPLIDAVRLIGRMSTLRITLDLDAMTAPGAGPREPVTLRLKNPSTAEILGAIAAQRGLSPVVAGGQIALTLPQEKRSGLRLEKHHVADLVREPASAGAELAALIRKLVAPASWQQAGGQGTIEFSGGSLAVRQTDPVHDQVRSFCRKLRLARGLSAGDSGPNDSADLQTRVDRAWAKLRQPVTINFWAPTAVEEILAELEAATETTILVDWAALGAARGQQNPNGVLQVHERPLCEALVELLQPLDLGYRIVGPDLFEVTTRKVVADRLELEFYPVKDLLAAGHTGQSLIERIRGQVAAATWAGAGGTGAMHLDTPSSHLIVLQSQPVQASAQILLRKMAAEKGSPAKAAEPAPPPPE